MHGLEHIGMVGGWIWMILVWLVPILLAVLLIRHCTEPHEKRRRHQTADDSHIAAADRLYIERGAEGHK